MTRWPAIVSSPLRDGPFVGWASYTTCPLPLPWLPCTTVSHSISLRAVHEHSGPLAVTVRVRRSPSGETVSLGGTVKTHGVASWLMATCCSLIAMAPRRCEGSAFVVTLKATVAFPCPEDPAPSCIQLSEDVALHEHSRFVLMVRVPPPPPAPNLAGSATAVTGHLEVEGPVTFWVAEVQADHEPHVRIRPTVVVSARIVRTKRARKGPFSHAGAPPQEAFLLQPAKDQLDRHTVIFECCGREGVEEPMIMCSGTPHRASVSRPRAQVMEMQIDGVERRATRA